MKTDKLVCFVGGSSVTESSRAAATARFTGSAFDHEYSVTAKHTL